MRTTLLLSLIVIMLAAACASAPTASPGPSDPGSLPTVTIESPASGTTVAVGETLQVSVRGEDVRGVSRLDLRVNDVLVATTSTTNAAAEPVFAAVLEWTPSAEGTVTVSAAAFRPTGTGSVPESIQVTVVPAGMPNATPFPSATLIAGGPLPTDATDTPADTDVTPAPRPTLPPPPPTSPPRTPRPTPKPTPKPDPATPKPDPTPPPATAAPTPSENGPNLRVAVRDRHIPDPWYAGTDVKLRVFVENRADSPSPRFSLRARIGGGDLVFERYDAGAIPAGEVVRFTIVLQAPGAGLRTLRVEARVLGDAEDVKPDDNIFTTEVEVSEAEPTPDP